MKKITKESWFAPTTKETPWTNIRHPKTWQGWAVTILFIAVYISLFYAMIFLKEWYLYWFIFVVCIFSYPVIVDLTSDESYNYGSGISNAEISRILKEKRKK